MRLVGFTVAEKFAKKHRDAAGWLHQWRAVVLEAAWKSLADVRADFQSADGVKLKSRIVVTVFNVKGNEYRMLTSVDYVGQTVLVLELMTHAEYSRDQWKSRF